jgi:ribosomal protein S18 acetylase RimI-like enzyme
MWRPMTPADLSTVDDIAEAVHPLHPENTTVFAERLRLYPEGCHVLESSRVIAGYVISHPWSGDPPALDTLVNALPAAPATYYIHDLALLPSARGNDAGATIIGRLIDHARQAGFATVSLVAVNGSEPFWHKLGFIRAADESLHKKLRSYGGDAALMRARI